MVDMPREADTRRSVREIKDAITGSGLLRQECLAAGPGSRLYDNLYEYSVFINEVLQWSLRMSSVSKEGKLAFDDFVEKGREVRLTVEAAAAVNN